MKNQYEKCEKCNNFILAPYWYPWTYMCKVGKYIICQKNKMKDYFEQKQND
jgi:hypothetical protein